MEVPSFFLVILAQLLQLLALHQILSLQISEFVAQYIYLFVQILVVLFDREKLLLANLLLLLQLSLSLLLLFYLYLQLLYLLEFFFLFFIFAIFSNQILKVFDFLL